MLRDLKYRVQENIRNYIRPTDQNEPSAVQLKAFSILNKKAAPKKKLTLSQKKAYKILNAPKRQQTLSEIKLNKAIKILLRK